MGGGMWERGALECPSGEEATCRAWGASLGGDSWKWRLPTAPPYWCSSGKPSMLDSRGLTWVGERNAV